MSNRGINHFGKVEQLNLSDFYHNSDDANDEYIETQSKFAKKKYDGLNIKKHREKKIVNPIFEKHPIIENNYLQTEYAPQKEEIETYDPYFNYLNKKGLNVDDKKTRYGINYININSGNRNKIPSIVTSKVYELENNPLSISENLVWINIPKHTLSINDRITLTGITYKSKQLKTITIDDDTGDLVYSIIFTNGNQYAKIMASPNIDVTSLGFLATSYDTSNMFVEISGLLGYPTDTYIGNIPLSHLNSVHRIYLGIPDSLNSGDNPSDNYFFIKLPKVFDGIVGTNGYNFTITYRFYGGIPVNMINADYPINNKQIKGYHFVHKTRTDYVAIEMPSSGYYSSDFGGNNLYVSFIDQIKTGYQNPNDYSISLRRTFNNIVQISLVSSEIPNTEKVFKNYPENIRNNRLYFQNIDEGNYTYYIEIDPGNYDANSLKSVLEKKFYETQKISVLEDTKYTKNNYVEVDIDTNTDIVTFSSFKEAFLSKPIDAISNPEISLLDTGIGTYDKYSLTMTHPSHNMIVGSTFFLKGCISHLGIPEDVLNSEHIVTNVIDNNTFVFQIENINLQSEKINTGGGFSVKIYTPNIFRLRFDYPDTMGKNLGFRNVGEESSITKYNTVITNNDLYEDEVAYDELGNPKNITNDSLILTGEKYIFMTCKEINVIQDTGPLQNIFAKFNLTGKNGDMIYNSFNATPKFFYDPYPRLSELSFSFFNSEGELFDFNGIDHSFTLEIVTQEDRPENTSLKVL